MEEYTAMELEAHELEYKKLKSEKEKQDYLSNHSANWFALGTLKRIYVEFGGTNKRLSNKAILYNEIIHKVKVMQYLNSK